MLEIKNKNYIFSLRKTTEGKFTHTSLKPNRDGKLSKYLIADCIDPDATKAFGVQTRKIVKTFFEGSMVYEELVGALKSGIIDKESGQSSKPLAGSFADIDCGFEYETEFNGTRFKQSTVSLFIMAGENFEVAKNRAIRAVAGMRVESDDIVQTREEITQSNAANTPPAQQETDDF